MGNICRSPLLEGWAQQAIGAARLAHAVTVDSAGTGRWHAGQPPDPRAVAAAARHGVDIAMQRARAVEPADFHSFDLMLCADRENLAWLRSHAPVDASAHIALVLEWTGVGPGREVPDPYYGPDAGFDQVCRLAQASAQGLLQRLRAQA